MIWLSIRGGTYLSLLATPSSNFQKEWILRKRQSHRFRVEQVGSLSNHQQCLQQPGAWWVWLTLIATAIQITSCLTLARDRRRYRFLTTTFSAPACLGQRFLLAGAWQV